MVRAHGAGAKRNAYQKRKKKTEKHKVIYTK